MKRGGISYESPGQAFLQIFLEDKKFRLQYGVDASYWHFSPTVGP